MICIEYKGAMLKDELKIILQHSP